MPKPATKHEEEIVAGTSEVNPATIQQPSDTPHPKTDDDDVGAVPPSESTVFPYTKLPAEIQVMIREMAIEGVGEQDGSKLSHLACVSAEWQSVVEAVTFAHLGKHDQPLVQDIITEEERLAAFSPSPFQGRDLQLFDQYTSGPASCRRRGLLRSIELDLELDVCACEGVRPGQICRRDQWGRCRHAYEDMHYRHERHKARFAGFMEQLFRTLSKWTAEDVRDGGISLSIRVYTPMPRPDEVVRLRRDPTNPPFGLYDLLDYSTLPLVNVVSHYEMRNICDPTKFVLDTYYHDVIMTKGKIYLCGVNSDEAADRFPNLSSLTYHLDWRKIGETHAVTSNVVRRVLGEIDTRTPHSVKKVRLSPNVTEGARYLPRNGFKPVSLQAIVALGARLETLIIDIPINASEFLACFQQGRSRLRWPEMQVLRIKGFIYSSDGQSSGASADEVLHLDGNKFLAELGRTIKCMPALRKLCAQVSFRFDIDTSDVIPLEVEVRVVEAKGKRDGHVLLSVKSPAEEPIEPTMETLEYWKASVATIWGLPLAVRLGTCPIKISNEQRLSLGERFNSDQVFLIY